MGSKISENEHWDNRGVVNYLLLKCPDWNTQLRSPASFCCVWSQCANDGTQKLIFGQGTELKIEIGKITHKTHKIN